MKGKRFFHTAVILVFLFVTVSQPSGFAASDGAASPNPPDLPGSVPGPVNGPKPTILLNINHAYLGQAVHVSGTAPAQSYQTVRIAWLFNGATYSAANAAISGNLGYSAVITVPLTSASGQAAICAAVANEPNAEFACAGFNLDTPPAGAVAGKLPAGSVQASAARHAPSAVSASISLTDRSGAVLYSAPIALDGSFTVSGVAPGIYGYAFSGAVSPGLPSGKVVVDPARTSPLAPILAGSGFDPVNGTICIGNFDVQVGRADASTSDSSFGYAGDYTGFTRYGDLLGASLGAAAALSGKDYDFGGYLEGVSLPITFHTDLQNKTGAVVSGVDYHLQKPDKTIVKLGTSITPGDGYSLLHDVKDFPAGRSKLIIAPVVGGSRQCPKIFSVQVDVDPMKDPHVQAGATTTWNAAQKWYDFQGTLVSAGGLLPFKYPNPEPDLPLLGKIENSFNAGLHVEGTIRLNGVVHLKILRALAAAKVLNQSLFDKSQELIDDSVAHIYTDLHDWHKTRVTFVPVTLWEDSFSTDVYKGPLASFWGIVTINASLSVGLGGQVVIEGTLYPFQPNLDATLRNKVTPSLTVSIWVDILLGVASAGADGNVAMGFSMPLRLNTNDPAHPEVIWMDTPCFSVKVTLSAWARVNLIFTKKTWNIGSYELVNYAKPAGCSALADAIRQADPQAVLAPPRVLGSPALAASASGGMLAAYVADATPAAAQSTPMVTASFFDTNNKTWLPALPVSDGLHNVQDPAVGFIGQAQIPVVAWTQTNLTLAQEEAAGDDINSYTNQQEIYYALFNSNSNTWGTPLRLTNDALPDGRAAISGDLSGATLAWTVNTAGALTNLRSLRIKVTDWDQQSNAWGPVYVLNGNGANPAMNSQVSVTRSPNLKALAFTLDVDGDIKTNGDRHILAAREAANWGSAVFDDMGTQPAGAESPSLALDQNSGQLRLAFVVRGKDGDGLSDTGIGNRAVLWTGQSNQNGAWTYQMLGDQGSPVYAEKPNLLVDANGAVSVVFRRFGAAGSNGLLGQLALAHLPAGGSFSNPGYLTDDASQHYQAAAALNPGLPGLAILDVNRAALAPGASPLTADQLKPAAPYQTALLAYQRLSTNGDAVESLLVNDQADLALDATLVISPQHAAAGFPVSVAVTLRNLGLQAASKMNTPIQVCLYNGAPPNGSLVSCQGLPANLNSLNYNDHLKFVFNLARGVGLQPLYASVSSGGYNGPAANDTALGSLGSYGAPLMTGVFADGSLPNALRVQWLPPNAASLGGYRLLRSKTAGGPYELVGETSGTTLPDLLLQLGQSYCYVVQAYGSDGVLSPYSAEACAALPLLRLYFPALRR